jgi:hypothetical protein
MYETYLSKQSEQKIAKNLNVLFGRLVAPLYLFGCFFSSEQYNRGYIYYNVSRFAYVRLSIKEAQILGHVRVR